MADGVWDRGDAERLYTELLILDRVLVRVRAREQDERDQNPSHLRPEQCKARPKTVKLREALVAKVAEGEARLEAMAANYVELWPAGRKPGG